MRKIFAICGMVGSGKTTFSKRLAKETGAFRFSLDEWMIPLFGEHMPRAQFDERQNQLTKLFLRAAEQLLELNVAVIFDFGFWEKQQRTEINDWARSIDADLELVYLRCDLATCRERVLDRNKGSHNVNYEISEEMLQMFQTRFEEPGKDETVTLINANVSSTPM